MTHYRDTLLPQPRAKDTPKRRSRPLPFTQRDTSARAAVVEPEWREHNERAAIRDTLALVMAGGRGARLAQLSAHRAKPAVPFAGKFRIIDFTLSNCVNSGVRRIGVLLQYEGHSLIRHLQQGWSFCRGHFGECLELLPAEQRQSAPDWYAGTADAVYQNIDFIQQQRPRHVLVLAGDHIYKMDYAKMLKRHLDSGAQVTVGCVEVPRTEACDFGVMQVNEHDRVFAFQEKPADPEPLPGRPDMALASMGIYVFDTDYLIGELKRDACDPASRHDFGHDLLPAAIGSRGVCAYRFRDLDDPSRMGYWRDVGHVDAYWKANLELTDVQPEFNLYDQCWPIWTHQLQAPPAKFVFDRDGQRGTALDSLVSGGCIVSGATVRRSVLFVNAVVESGSQIEETLLLPGVRVGRNCRLRRAVIDEGCRIPDGMVVGHDPAADAARFHVTEGGVTLVTPDMLPPG